jgi:hypothetical protein
MHLIEHISDVQRSKCGHQHSVGNIPIVLARECGEEAVFDTISNLYQCCPDLFGKALLITHLVDESLAGKEEPVLTVEAEFIYFTWNSGSTSIAGLVPKD